MLIVKKVDLSKELPAEVLRELDRVTGGRPVTEEWFNNYRDAALALLKKPMKLSQAKLYSLADEVKDKDLQRELFWAIANTRSHFFEARARAGEKLEEWSDEFMAELKPWYRSQGESHFEHPAVLLSVLLKRVQGAKPKKESEAHQRRQYTVVAKAKK